MVRKGNVFILLLGFCLLSFIATACINDEDPDGGNISLNDKLPQFSVIMNNGTEVSTQNLKGKIGMIMFFNTNCPDCQKELPVVQKLWEIYKENDEVVIIPISREEDEDEINDYWDKNGLTMPFSAQKNRDIYSLFAKSIIPRIYISNRDCSVIFMSGDEDMPSLNLLIDIIDSH